MILTVTLNTAIDRTVAVPNSVSAAATARWSARTWREERASTSLAR